MAPTSVKTSVMLFEPARSIGQFASGNGSACRRPKASAPAARLTQGSLMQIGVYTFVENTPDPATGQTQPATQRLRDLMEEVELADQVGLEVFGIGEHHR